MNGFKRGPAFAGLFFLFLLFLLPLPSPATADDLYDCFAASGDAAIAACSRAIESRSRQPWITYNNRGWHYFKKGDIDRAIADYNESIRLDPKYALAYNNRGWAYYDKGDIDRAFADYNEAIRLDPKYVFAYNNRGNAYRDQGDIDRAIADFNKAIRLDRKYVHAYNNRCLAYAKKGDNDRAIADCNEAIRLDPKFVQAYNNRGTAYSAKGDNDRAIADYNESIRLDPKAQAYNNRGLVYYDKGDNDRAIADYNESIRLDPKFVKAYVNRGVLYEKSGDAEKARADFNAALELSGKDDWAFNTARAHLATLQSPTATDTSHAPTTVIAPVAPPALNDRRVALVIGNSAYENVPALPNPARDAKLVADVLERTGFKSVTMLTNLKKDALVSALRNFASLAETSDWAVIYYAGHGMEVGGINYLVPVDATIAADRDISFEAVPLDQVLNAVERANKLRLVILDACRDNPFKAKMKRTLTVASRSVSVGLAAIEPAAGTIVVYAAKDGQQATDGDGIDSPFTLAFVKNVQTPGLEVRRLFDYVRDDVMEMTGNQQQPFSYGSISGRRDFYFVATK